MALAKPANPAKPLDEVNSFFDKITIIMSQSSCEEAGNAVGQIPDSAFERIQTLIQQLDAADLKNVEDKIQKMTTQTAHCPKAQDALANRMSRIALVHQITSDERSQHIGILRQFVRQCENAIVPDNCAQSAENLKTAITPGLCARTLNALKTVPANSLSDSEHTQIAGGLSRVVSYSDSCSEYQKIYQDCLYPGRIKTDNQISTDAIQPFMKWLSELYTIASTSKCEEITHRIQSIDPGIIQNAKQSVVALTPSKLTQDARKEIQQRMHQIYQSAARCPGAKDTIDNLIESVFAP